MIYISDIQSTLLSSPKCPQQFLCPFEEISETNSFSIRWNLTLVLLETFSTRDAYLKM